MNLEETILERYRADETFRYFINTYYHSYDLVKPVIHTPIELAQFFGGVLKVYLDCCTDLTSLELPAKLEQLVTYINTHQPIPDKLIQYASSPNLWVGMTFSSHDIPVAIKNGRLGYLKWRATWDKDIYTDVQDMFDIALIYDQVEVAKWLLDNHNLHIFDKIYQNIIDRDCINVFKLLYQRELIVIKDFHIDNYYWNRLKYVLKKQILRDCVSRDAIKIGTYITPLIDISQDDIKNVIHGYCCTEKTFRWLVPLSEHPVEFFQHCCRYSLNTIKWFYQQYQPTTKHFSYCKLFHRRPSDNTFKWLLSKFPIQLHEVSEIRCCHSDYYKIYTQFKNDSSK